MRKFKISAVSYLNTYPFLYGLLQNSYIKDKIEISTDYPSVCAEKLKTNIVDIGLIPVAALNEIPNAKIITDYCIAAYKSVKSVMLFSDVNLNEIDTILLDYQSRTSVKLVQVLASKLWHIKPKWIHAKDGFEKNINKKTAAVVIGDKALNRLEKHKFEYDLSSEWYRLTNLPFVFALWVSNKHIPHNLLNELNKSLNYGIENINDTITFYKDKLSVINFNAKDYLTQNIDYKLNNDKLKAITNFQNYLSKL